MNGKVLLKHSRYGIPIIIFLSIIPQFYYYSIFGINLGSYISIIELPTLFINEFLWFLLLSVLPYILFTALLGKNIGSANADKLDKIAKEQSFIRRLRFYLKDDWLGFFAITTNIICYLFRYDSIFLYSSITMAGCVILSMFLREVVVQNKIIVDQEYSTTFNSIQFLFIALMIFVIRADLKATKLISETAKNSVTIFTSNKTIYCKYNLQYIGRTKDYTFIFDRKKNRTEILKNSEIEIEKLEIN